MRTINVVKEGNVTVKVLDMHDLAWDMGREIVRKESPKDSGKRSKIWTQSDVLPILQNHLVSAYNTFSFWHWCLHIYILKRNRYHKYSSINN